MQGANDMNGLWNVNHISVNPFSRPGRKLRGISFIVWHYTANPGASAANHERYFESLKNQDTTDSNTDRYASAHIFVDRDSALEIIPLDEEAYHAGQAWYNMNSIGIELCIEKDGSFHPDTIARAVKIGAVLCKRFDLNPLTKTIRHYDVTGKICPKPWVENPKDFFDFKNRVSAAMKGEYRVNAADANKIIDNYLKPAYGAAKTDVERREVGRLADELRKASGQKTQNG